MKTSRVMCLLVVCVLNVISCKILSWTDDEELVSHKSIANCVLAISEKYFSSADIVDIASIYRQHSGINFFNNNILKMFYINYKWAATVRLSTEKTYLFNKVPKTNNYIIHLQRLEDLNETLIYLKQSRNWNPYAKFIVTSHSIFENPLHTAANLTKIMWPFLILNAVIMLPSNVSESDLLNIYTWYPYAHGNCADKFNETQVINRCKNGELENAEVNLFPEKIPTNLNGCYVKVRVVELSPYIMLPKGLDKTKGNLNITEGVEIELLTVVSKMANIKLNYSVSNTELDWGIIREFRNSTLYSTGLMNSLLNEEIDIGIGAIGEATLRNKYLDVSVPYIYDTFAWIVPYALREAKWKCLFNIFNLSTWVLTFVTLMLVTLCLWGLSYNSPNESLSFVRLRNCTLNTLGVLLGISVQSQPKRGFNRIFFILWIIFSLHMTICYQTSLISVLTRPSYKKQISTVEELFESKISFGFVGTAIRFFRHDKSWQSRKIYKEWMQCKNAIKCLHYVAYNRNYSFAASRLFLRYNEGKFRGPDGRPLLYMFKDNIVAFPVIMQFRRGFPFIHRVNNLLIRIVEGGLVDFWFDKVLSKRYMNDKLINDSTEQKLSLFNVQAAFIILGFGLFIASVVFVAEIIIQKCKTNM